MTGRIDKGLPFTVRLKNLPPVLDVSKLTYREVMLLCVSQHVERFCLPRGPATANGVTNATTSRRPTRCIVDAIITIGGQEVEDG